MGNIKLLEFKFVSKMIVDYSKYSDKDLLALCQKYGKQAILWKRKFIGLLPEVDRRRLYEKKKCVSIYEFAAKFGGVTNEQAKRVISIDKTLAESGLVELREKLINGEVSLNKLARVVSVANKENEKILIDAMKKLSQSSLETFVKDERNRQIAELLGGDGHRHLQETEKSCEDMFVRAHKGDYEISGVAEQVGGGNCIGEERGNAMITGRQMSELAGLRDLQLLGLDAQTVERLKKLREQGHDLNEILNRMLDKREENIAEQKEETVRKVTGREERRKGEGKKPVRQISVGVKRILKEEYGTKCAVGGCDKTAMHLHHTVPFSINRSNSPDLLRPLCRAHHDIVHSMNTRYLEKKGMGQAS